MIRERVRLGILLSPEGLANPLGVWKISSLTNIVKKKKKKVKVEQELHVCSQTEDDISLWLGIVSRNPQHCNVKSRPWGGHTA